MKTRSILPFAVLGILLALLLAVSACDGDDDESGNDWPWPTYTPAPSTAANKVVDFQCYKKNGLSLSKAVKLDSGLLEQSLKASVAFPYGAKKQKYNYVIDDEGKIIVAEWNVEDLAKALKNAKANATKECKGKQCEGDADFIPRGPRKMVNWFPEDKLEDLADPQSLCWLNRIDNDGLLDAISKHFMLAQGPGEDIGKFKEGWKDTEVRYAGELTVDVVGCTYTLNNNSGTYKPKLQGLKDAAKHFANEIDVGPIKAFNFIYNDEGKLTLKDPVTTNNLFDTTTKISNCP